MNKSTDDTYSQVLPYLRSYAKIKYLRKAHNGEAMSKNEGIQIALAIRDEVLDLEKANINIIQIDEPALREGLPLRKNDWKSYLDWAVKAFSLSYAGVKDE